MTLRVVSLDLVYYLVNKSWEELFISYNNYFQVSNTDQTRSALKIKDSDPHRRRTSVSVTMKMLLVVVLTLICFLCHSSDGQAGVEATLNSACCNGYSKVKVPKEWITHMVMASSPCPGIVVTTVCGKKICMDPDWKFAQAVLRHFENSTAENGSPSAPFNVKKCSKKQ
ncbi:uncharacterized protein LOC113174120 isoform X2 [Anabas testudineus]|uniref:uncharacterized protein LOC113174120 isoform X2 n=1 Tax=Anabas testudineus TaxID=64144 RepID=UPI000E45C501|nr:uncharacterized protein LOC113174120 isoform X2 [Anabas testudineus]